jgi:Sigma-70 region 2
MGQGQPGSALRQLRALLSGGTTAALTDGELLERYKASRVESAEAATAAELAFAALVDRHGAMVWGVCRRVLGDAHEAEDAFQATFLILVRKARSVRVDGALALRRRTAGRDSSTDRV